MKLKKACGLVRFIFSLSIVLSFNYCDVLPISTGSFSAASDIETLKQRHVTHILTLDICPLPVHITELPFLKTKYIHGRHMKHP